MSVKVIREVDFPINWKPIAEFQFPPVSGWYDQTESFIVSNGFRVGEAVAQYLYNHDNADMEDVYTWQWSWTHHSTCACCFSAMDPQPEWFQPMPEPPEIVS